MNLRNLLFRTLLLIPGIFANHSFAWSLTTEKTDAGRCQQNSGKDSLQCCLLIPPASDFSGSAEAAYKPRIADFELYQGMELFPVFIPFDTMVFRDSVTWNRFASEYEITLNRKIDFTSSLVVFESVFLDCSGKYLFLPEFDQHPNNLNIHRYEIYGGSRGMCDFPVLLVIHFTSNPDQVRFFRHRI